MISHVGLAAQVDSVTFEFDPERDTPAGSAKKLAASVSAVVAIGDSIFVGGDEGTTLVRLEERDEGRRFAEKDAIDLGGWFDLPQTEPAGDGNTIPEVDLEGLALDQSGRQPHLWLLGSHSFKSGKAKSTQTTAQNIGALGEISLDANRLFLGYVPLLRKGEGNWRIPPSPTPEGGRAAQIDPRADKNPLLLALRRDTLLGLYLTPGHEIPGKDNGLDFEGLATLPNGRVLVGLRGPVLRGIAVLLELEPKRIASAGTKSDRLELAPIGPDQPSYRRHFLDLEGNGVRDLCWDGPDLLILAGPTLALDSPPRIFRWSNAASAVGKGSDQPEEFYWTHRDKDDGRPPDIKDATPPELVLAGPARPPGYDHAESLALVDDGRRLLIAYDAPSSERLKHMQLSVDSVGWP